MLTLILVHSYTNWLDPVSTRVGSLAKPFYWVTNIPQRMSEWGNDTFTTRNQLLAENKSLRKEVLVLQGKLQTMASLGAENVRLRQLLNSADMVDTNVLVAELVGVSPDPLVHTVVVNKGANHGVYEGQPLLDATGLMGQVIQVMPNYCRVLLITDSTHALPVQINRNGVRAIADGVGTLYELHLRHVSNTTDIREGDLLVSSGLGGRFPVGYPVATVTSVLRDPGQSFASVIARPKAQLNRSRHVLLVFGEKPVLP